MAAATIIVDSKHNNVKATAATRADPGKNVLGPSVDNSIGNRY